MREICHSLKKTKAACWDLAAGEHMIYGSDTLYNILTLICNHISASHNVPVYFRKGIIVPIPKGKDKNVLSKDNHRGITLVYVVYIVRFMKNCYLISLNYQHIARCVRLWLVQPKLCI